MATLKKLLNAAGIDGRAWFQTLAAASLEAAVREQGLADTIARLRTIVPETRDQYTATFDSAEYQRYWELKMRGLHAFQVQAALEGLARIDGQALTVADIGDSSGNHAAYLKALAPAGKLGRFVSVNMDPVAIEKIRAKGGEAELARAEGLPTDLRADLYLCFETLEHLTDPVRFLHKLARESGRGIVLSMPYRRVSRFGGELLRYPLDKLPADLTPEAVHIFELSPEDWKLLARFSGFRCVFERRYLQYPTAHPLRLLAPMWRRLDFEGFIALFLIPDSSLSSRYTGW